VPDIHAGRGRNGTDDASARLVAKQMGFKVHGTIVRIIANPLNGPAGGGTSYTLQMGHFASRLEISTLN
jgi:hypothetical protein